MKCRGFTLLEVLIAVVILVGGVMVVTTSWSGNFLRVRKTNLYNNVSLLLERKVVEIQAQLKDKPLEEIVDQEGDFGTDLPQYRWEFKTHDFEMPDLSSLMLAQSGIQDEMLLTMIKQVSEYLSKAIKEGKVIVYVKSGAKEVPFSVTTYFVDYSKDLSLPGLPAPSSGGGSTPKGGGGQ